MLHIFEKKKITEKEVIDLGQKLRMVDSEIEKLNSDLLKQNADSISKIQKETMKLA